jgi:PAS domain S-box-containing protein
MKRYGLSFRFVIGCVALALIVAGSFAVMLSAIEAEHTATDAARESDAEVDAAGLEQRLVVDMETGLRGFQIAEEERFLAPYINASNQLPGAIARLDRLVSDEPEEKKFVAPVHADIRDYQENYARPLQSRVRQGMTTAEKAEAAAEGKRRIDTFRDRFGEFIAAERASAVEARREADESSERAVWFGAFGLGGSLLIIALFCWYFLRLVLKPIRRTARAAQRLAEGDLSARVPSAGTGEIADLATSFNAMADSLEHSRYELESQNSELEAQQAEMERAVDDLAFEKERVERLHSFGRAVSTEIELERVADTVLKELCTLVNAQLGAVYAHVGDRASATCVGTLGLGTPATVPSVEPNRGLSGRALAESRTMVARHTEAQLSSPVFGEDVVVRHEVHIPLVHGRQVVGLLSLGRTEDAVFSPVEIDQIEHFANRAAAAVANALTLRAAQGQAALNEAVLETAADAFVSIDGDGCVTAWNRAAEETFGWSASEVIGRLLAETIVPPEHREAHRLGVERVASGGESTLAGRRIELTALHRDGREFPVEVLISPLEIDGVLQFNAFLRDISDRRRSDQFMAAQYSVTRALSEATTLDDARVGIIPALAEALGFDAGTAWVVDHEAGLVRNTAVWSAEGVDASELLEASQAAVFHRGEGLPGRVWASGEPLWISDVSKETSFPRAAGALAAGIRGAFIYPVMSGDKIIGMGELFSRESIREEPELGAVVATIGSQIGQFSERKRAELEADRLKDEFFALVSHELRTPLTSIIGYLELVLEDAEDLPPDASRFLQVVERNSRRLYRLVGDLLFVAQVEAGKLSLERGDVDLEATIAACVEAARPRAEENGVVLRANTQSIATTRGDADRIGQVLDNLVSNAIKFTPEGGTVDVTLGRVGQSALIEVRDTGIGIPASEQDRMFQRFFRSTAATAQAIPGVGLGLVISRAIVEAHGGEINFESQEGHGTTFRIALPLGSPDHQASNKNPQEVVL